MARLSVLLCAISVAACVRTPVLPDGTHGRERAHVAVLSGEMPGAFGEVGRHSWIVAYRNGRYRRYEWLGTARATDTDNPLDYFGNGEVSLHGVVVEDVDAMAACLERETAKYDSFNCGCWPGPNSNTFTDGLIRTCGVGIELPATAVGRDYRGPIGISGTEAKTGILLQTWVFGAKIGAKEGVSANLTGLSLGVHFWPPGLDVPIGVGRIGADERASFEPDPTARDEHAWRPEDSITHRHGSVSIDMHASYDRVGTPAEAHGLSSRTLVGLEGHGVYGKRVGLGFGFDLGIGIGTGSAAGFAYRAHVMPIGFGLVLGDTGFVALTSGIGTSGVSSMVPGVFELPQELRVEVDVTRAARLGLYGGILAMPLSRDPETFMGGRARLGTRVTGRDDSGAAAGGFFFGLERRELFHTYFLGGSFGYEIGAGG